MQSSDSAAAAGSKRALLIGIDGYPMVRRLHGCVNDVVAIREFLTTKAGFPDANVTLLIGPDPLAPPPAELPGKQQILDALGRLADASGPGDEVVVYYSGHGVSIPNPALASEQIGAIVPWDADLSGRNFLLNSELNQAIVALARKATVTVVLDCCHSGGATRGIDPPAEGGPVARELVLTEEQVQAVQATLRAELALAGAPVGSGADSRGLGGSGWGLESGMDALIVVSGCQAAETSQEQAFPTPAGPHHGALTYFLLNTLQGVGAADSAGGAAGLAQATWQEIYPRTRQGVQALFPGQTPTLEGRAERPVFGGQWQPYAPGFTVTAADAMLALNGGAIHGLDDGAEVAIYPPGTPDFAKADKAGAPTIRAVVAGRSGPVSCTITAPGGEPVADQSRARLTKPSTVAPRLGVGFKEALPPGVRKALEAAPEVANFLSFTPAGNPDVEVRPAASIGPAAAAAGGAPPAPPAADWVLVPYSNAEPTLTWNDVIAWTAPIAAIRAANPPRAGQDAQQVAEAALGDALGRGLVHWAKYWATLNRRNPDDLLRGALTVSLELATRPSPDWNSASDWRALSANEAGQDGVRAPSGYAADGSPLGADLLRVNVAVGAAPGPLSVGVLLCSNDGNIQLLWPPAGQQVENTIAPGGQKRMGLVGWGGLAPFYLTADRPEQTASLYTIKVFASNGPLPVAVDSLAIDAAVQDVIDTWLGLRGDRGGARPATSPLGVLWTTVELPVVARKRPTGG